MSKLKILTIRVPHEDYELLRDTGAKYGLTMSAYTNRILRLGMQAEGILRDKENAARRTESA